MYTTKLNYHAAWSIDFDALQKKDANIAISGFTDFFTAFNFLNKQGFYVLGVNKEDVILTQENKMDLINKSCEFSYFNAIDKIIDDLNINPNNPFSIALNTSPVEHYFFIFLFLLVQKNKNLKITIYPSIDFSINSLENCITTISPSIKIDNTAPNNIDALFDNLETRNNHKCINQKIDLLLKPIKEQ